MKKILLLLFASAAVSCTFPGVTPSIQTVVSPIAKPPLPGTVPPRSPILVQGKIDGGLNRSWDIYRLDPDGNEAINLTDTPLRQETNPRLSPDGKAILITVLEDGGAEELWLLPPEGGAPRRLTDSNLGRRQASLGTWAPTGKAIVYLQQDLSSSASFSALEFRILFPEDGRSRALLHEAVQEVAWSPSGEWLAFAYRKGNISQIGFAEADGERQRLFSSEGIVSGLAWTGDSSALLYQVHRRDTDGDGHITSGDLGEIYAADPNSGADRNLTPNGYDNRDASTAPVGNRFLFRSNLRTGAFDIRRDMPLIFLAALSNPSPKPIVPAAEAAGWEDPLRFYRFSPDGGTIILQSGTQTFTVPAEGGTPSLLFRDPDPTGVIEWSPDGQRVAYPSRELHSTDIRVIRLGAEASLNLTRPLTHWPHEFTNPEWWWRN